MLTITLGLAAALAGCGSASGSRPAPPAARAETSVPATAPSTTAVTTSPTTTAPGTAPASASRPHVLLVVLENREASDVIGSSDAPYLNALARRYGLATSSFARTHPSLPNYLDLISGSTHGISSDCTDCAVDGPTLADQLSSAGIPWKAYLEGAPTPCYTGVSSDGGYAKKHDPFVYFRHLVADRSLCDRLVPYSRLAGDLSSPTPPSFAWITPNVCHDGHGCDTATMDHWLSGALGPVLSSPWFAADGVVIVTFDEGGSDASCCGVAVGGKVATIVATNRVPGGRRLTRPVDTAGILATVEDLYGLAHLGEAASTSSGNLLYLTGTPST